MGWLETAGPLVGLVGGGIGIVNGAAIPAAKWFRSRRNERSAQAKKIYATVERSGGMVRAHLRNVSTESVTNVFLAPAIQTNSGEILPVPKEHRLESILAIVQEVSPGGCYLDMDLSNEVPEPLKGAMYLQVFFTDAANRSWERVANGTPVQMGRGLMQDWVFLHRRVTYADTARE